MGSNRDICKLRMRHLVKLVLVMVILLISSNVTWVFLDNTYRGTFQNTQKISLRGSTPPLFYDFRPNKSLILNPTCTLAVYDLETGLNVGSEEFGYTKDGSAPAFFINPHCDDFQDGKIGQFWSYLNPSSGTLSEANGNITIDDTGTNDEWGAAPGLLQRITGDFSITAKIYARFTANTQQAGIYVYQDSGNILRFHYIQAPSTGSPKNVAMRYRTGGTGNILIGAAVEVGEVAPIWLKLERINTTYYSYYSLNGLAYSAVASGLTSPDLSNEIQVGIYTGYGFDAKFDDWMISPSIQCTASNGTTQIQQITIEKVPFNQYHPSNNKVQVRMRDMNLNLGTSALFTVNISSDFGGPTFTTFSPNATNDLAPDVTLQVQDAEDGLLVGSEEFAYSTDGTIPSDFINPHHDTFNDGAIPTFWAIENSLGNIITESNNLSIWDTHFSWGWGDDPFLFQRIKGDFITTTKDSALLAKEGNQSGIAFKDGNNFIRIMVHNTTSNNLNVSLSYSTNNGESNIVIGSVTIGKVNPIWLRLRRSGPIFYGGYSTTGDYGIYSDVANISLAFNPLGRVGIFVGGGERATFADWEITPSLTILAVNGSQNSESFNVYKVPFNQVHESNNKIRFKMSDMIGNLAISTTYTVNTTEGHYIYNPDLTLANREGRIELFDYQGNTVWYYSDLGCDLEMLPDGNIMYVKVQASGGFVRIVNYTDKTTIWEYNPTGAEILDWTHDADILPWGDIIIADTTNDGTHRDEVLIIDYATKAVEWTYVCDEGSYPNDVDYLPNGNILISLRNYDMVIEVNYTACKALSSVTYPNYVVWSYGQTGNYTLLNHQHNPDRLPNGNTVICDSENDRIVEIDSSGKVVWSWGNSSVLDWPRDADRLPNGNTLIGDSNHNRVLEINSTTGKVVWQMSLGSGIGAYDVNRIDTIAPTSSIISPSNTTYTTESIDITLDCSDPNVDIIWYRIYNKTRNNWVDYDDKIWNNTVQRFLSNGNYIIYAWCNDTGYREGSWDWMPFKKGNIQLNNVTTHFIIDINLANFWNFYPNQTIDTTPNLNINVQDLIHGLKPGSEAFAYTKDGSVPNFFGNPHRDLFDDGTIDPFWRCLNPISGIIREEDGFINLLDNGQHEWYNRTQNAVAIYQDLVGDFSVSTKINVNAINQTNYFGIIARQNESNYITVSYHRNSTGELNIIFTKMENNNLINIKSESFSSFGFLSPIWLKLSRNGNFWTAAFSPNGNTYANYYDIAPPQFSIFNSKVAVGLFVANGSNALFDDWTITPYIGVNGSGSPTSVKTIRVYEVPFKQYDEFNNKIRFQVENQLNLTTTSQTYTINISNFAISFRDNTLYGDVDKKIYEIDRFGGPVRSIDVSGLGVESIADVERLSNGDILFVDMHQPGSDSAVYQINSSGYVLWSYKPLGSNRLEWTHDADRLDNGNTLIADTSNSGTHTDRVIEINSTGEILWAYYPGEGSYPNDVDRLRNGNTLISLRNWDKIIEVNPNGTIVWEYSPNNHTTLFHQHNPDRLLNGNIIICDSENNRIIEINSTSNELVWIYDGNGTTTLNWPRDADPLLNGNLLITDSKNHRIIEINKTTGKIVWEIETIGVIYEVDRLNTFISPVKILSPLNNEIWMSQTIEVVLSSPNPLTDILYYRLYDNTTSCWIDTQDQTCQKYQIQSNGHWNIRQQRILKDNHTYSLFAWVNATPNISEGGDHHSITQGSPTQTYFGINCSYVLDFNSPYPGFTLFPLDKNAGSLIREINAQGDIIWEYLAYPGTNVYDVERLPNGNTLFSNNQPIQLQEIEGGAVIEIDLFGNIIWNYPIADWCHDADRLPNGNTLLLAEPGYWYGNWTEGHFRGILEVNPAKETVWSWNIYDWFGFPLPANTHYNDIDLLPNGNILVSLRDWDAVWEINRTGYIVWSYGLRGNYSLMNHQHNPDRLTNGNTIIADSENNRIIEVTPEGNIVWMYDGNGTTTLDWPRDADRLPNSNTLIADSNHNRLLEINSRGEIIWEISSLPNIYCADRLDLWAPYVLINTPSNQTYTSNEIPLDLFCPERDVDAMWFNVYDSTNKRWVFPSNQSYSKITNLYLPNANYVLYAWSNDTGRSPSTMDDIHSNIQKTPSTISFTVSCPLNVQAPQNRVYSNPFFEILVENSSNFNKIFAKFELGVNISSIELSWNGSIFKAAALLAEDGNYKLDISGIDALNYTHHYILFFSLDRSILIFKDIRIRYDPLELGALQQINLTFSELWNKKSVNISINHAPNESMHFTDTFYFYNWTPISTDLGLNSIEIFAENFDGHKNSTLLTFLVIDTLPPDIFNIIYPSAIYSGEVASLTFNAADLGGIKEVLLDLEPGTDVILQGTSFYFHIWSPAAPENLSITIFVTDYSNNTQTFHFSIIVKERVSYNWVWYVLFGVLIATSVVVFIKIRQKKKLRRPQTSRKVEPPLKKIGL